MGSLGQTTCILAKSCDVYVTFILWLNEFFWMNVTGVDFVHDLLFIYRKDSVVVMSRLYCTDAVSGYSLNWRALLE